jgi:hypothetical protein
MEFINRGGKYKKGHGGRRWNPEQRESAFLPQVLLKQAKQNKTKQKTNLC